MQTLTFTQKLLRQRHIFRSLIPLFALFLGLGASQTAKAQGPQIDDGEIVLDVQPTGAGSATTMHYATPGSLDAPYTGYTKLGSSSPATAAPNLGLFDINNAGTSALLLTGSSLVAEPITGRTAANPTAARLLYRVYLVGTSLSNQPSFSVLTLGNPRPYTAFPGVVLFDATTSVNLLSSLLGGGNYVIESKFEADYSSGTTSQAVGNPYTATFSVTAPTVTPPGGTTTWVATLSTDWTMAANWSNGVPTQFSDAIIPEKNGTNTNTSTPALLDSNPTLYNVRSITLNGTSNATRALLRIGQTVSNVSTGATLNVYGDLNTFSGGILATTSGANGVRDPALNSTIALRGNIQQVVRGLLVISDITVSGTGNKLVVNSIVAANTFTFLPGTTARMRTVSETVNPSTGVSTFTINTTKNANVNLKTTGILSGETNDAYIEGVTLSDRNLQAGVTQTFGNIGVDITPNRDIVGPTVEITRTVGDPLSGPTAASQPTSGGTPGAKPVKRQYGISGDVNNAPTISTVVFHYLDSPDELNDNPEANLIIFRTTNNGIPYAAVGGTVNTTDNTVTKTGVRAINTITLGDSQKPLPVRLTAFDAKRIGSDALVTWQSATEENSKGYDVQVSANGTEYRTLSFVSSASPNTMKATDYSYVDKEANKTGKRYYRLHQIDLDGKDAFFAPVVVSFDGKATASGFVAYPNPLNAGNDLHVALQSTATGTAKLLVTDMTGRTLQQQNVVLTGSLTDASVAGMSDLKGGMYLVKITLPTGEVKTLKVVKQ